MVVAMSVKRSPSSGPAPRGNDQARLRRTARIAVGVVLAAGLVWAALHEQVSASPGYNTWQDKTSLLLRDAGFGGLLDRVGNLGLSHGAPPDTAPDPHSLTLGAARAAGPGQSLAAYRAAYAGLPPLAKTADNAGWHPVIRRPDTSPAVYTALIQPDPAHRSVVAGAAILRADAIAAHLVAGTAHMRGRQSAGRIPSEQLPDAVAAFNSGLNTAAQAGGLFVNGATVHALADGKASAVIDDKGRLTVGRWGRDVLMSPHILAVHQNFNLIVDYGKPVAGLNRDTDLRWGNAGNQLLYTWRSGLGITAHHDVVYVAGDKLTLDSLARALIQAGAVTGMELDKGDHGQFFGGWQDDRGGVHPQRLLATMPGPADRYIRVQRRDLFYFTTATPEK
jgi:Phosphodiester glycosidase